MVGIAGSPAKCDLLTSELGFHAALDYHRPNLASALRRAAPDGVDCYFDNVGGAVSQAVVLNMNQRGRVAVCGAISGYQDSRPALLPALQPSMVAKQLRMEGFLVWRWLDRWQEATVRLTDWLEQGELVTRQTEYQGFLSLPAAFTAMLQGRNTGKMIVRA